MGTYCGYGGNGDVLTATFGASGVQELVGLKGSGIDTVNQWRT
jgi:hypothetical protein